jgi:hypothetical protein
VSPAERTGSISAKTGPPLLRRGISRQTEIIMANRQKLFSPGDEVIFKNANPIDAPIYTVIGKTDDSIIISNCGEEKAVSPHELFTAEETKNAIENAKRSRNETVDLFIGST